MKLLIYRGPCDLIPRGYGVAYLCYNREGGMCAPIPLNVVIACGRAAWFWVMHFGAFKWLYPKRVKERRDAYWKGYHEGITTGEAHGREMKRLADEALADYAARWEKVFAERGL